MKVLLSLLLLIQSAIAADCVIGEGSNAVTVLEAERNSLFDAGKSLSSFKVQDQDGLGTCYANATSAVLKSVLPNNPDVSYVNSALEASTRGVNASWVSNNQRFMRRNGTKVQDITYGGFTCRTVEAVKNAGGACPASQSILENRTLRDAYVQERLMKNMGTYFDELNSIQGNPEEAQKFKDQLALTVESLNSERSKLIEECNADKNSTLPLNGALKRMIAVELFSIARKPCETQIRNAFKAMLPRSVISADRAQIILDDNIKNKFVSSLQNYSSIRSLITKAAQGGTLTPQENLSVMDNFGPLLRRFLVENLNTPELTACLNNGTYTPSTDNQVLGTSFIADVKRAKQINCEQELPNDVVISAVRTAEGNQCIPPARLEAILAAITPLMEVGSAIDANMLNSLSNPLATLGNQLKQMIAPGCQNRSNLINMDNVGCKSYSTCQESDLGSIYGGPAGGCTTLAEAKKVLGKQIINGIRQGRALGIDVCTAFMQNPATVSNFCKNAPPGVPGHSFHAMAVSGYRCVAGKMEYEILNSWGKESCPIKNAPFKNSAIECVLDANGRPTGKWWAKEDVLIDNTTRVNDVSTGAP